jgi:hypothetical protein
MWNDTDLQIDQDDYGVWKFLEEPLKTQAATGLRSIVWKTKNGVVKTLENIQLLMVPGDDKIFQYPSIPLNWYLKPSVNLFLVQCEVISLSRSSYAIGQ